MPNPLKIMLVGDTKAGKTGLINRFVNGHKPDLNHYQATPGAGSCIKDSKLNIANNFQDLPLQIWDTAGDESLRVFGHAFFKNADAIILMVSPQAGETKQTFLRRAKLSINTHHDEIQAALPKVPPIFLMLGKSDLITENLSEIAADLSKTAQQYNLQLSNEGKVFTSSALDSTDAEIAAPFLVLAKAGIKFNQDIATSAPKQQAGSDVPGSNKWPSTAYNFLTDMVSYLNKISGAILGGVLATFTALVLFNPITLFYAIIRFAFFIFDTTLLGAAILLTFSPVIAGLGGIIIAPLLGFYLGLRDAWRGGLIAGIKIPLTLFNTFTYATSDEKSGGFSLPRLRKADVVFGFLITVLLATVAVMVLFPATFGLAAVLPVAIASLGLTSLSAIAIAAIAGAVTFVTASIMYGIGSHIYDVYFAHLSAYKLLDGKNTVPLDAGRKYHDVQSYTEMAKKMPGKLNTEYNVDIDPNTTSPSPIAPPVERQLSAMRAAASTVTLKPA